MKKASGLILLTALLAGPALAAPKFTAYYGDDAEHVGHGGEMEVVEGMEVWSNGQPPRRHKVIGYLTDRRHQTGLVGAIRMSGLKKAVVKAAHEAGGDAVVLVGEGSETIGYANSGGGTATAYGNSATAYGGSISAAVKKHNSRYAVIVWLPDEPAPEPGE